jgi:hypothetical protein
MACGVPKEECEVDFNKCLVKHCKSMYGGNTECLDTAGTYVAGVRMFGCQGFIGSQEVGCSCLKRSDIYSHSTNTLTRFYERFNSSKTSADVTAALSKYKGKEGTMWKELFKLYPKSIEIISRDGQRQKPSGRGSEL